MRKIQTLCLGLLAFVLFSAYSPVPTGTLPSNGTAYVTLRPGETRVIELYDYETLIVNASTPVKVTHKSVKTDRWVVEQIDRMTGRWMTILDHRCPEDLPRCSLEMPLRFPNPMGSYYITPAMCGGGVRQIEISADL